MIRFLLTLSSICFVVMLMCVGKRQLVAIAKGKGKRQMTF